MEDAREYLSEIPAFAREKHSLSQAESFFPGAGLSVSGPGDPRGGNQRKGICLRLPLIHSPGIRISCGNIYFSPSDGHPGADLSGRGAHWRKGISAKL